MTVPVWVWGATILAVLLLIAFDFFTVSRTPHEVGIGEAARWSIFYVALAVAFGIGVYYFMGSQSGTEFFTAYLVEKSLSVDNLFVFAIIPRSLRCLDSSAARTAHRDCARADIPSRLHRRWRRGTVGICVHLRHLRRFAHLDGYSACSPPQRGSAALRQPPGRERSASVIRSLMITTERQMFIREVIAGGHPMLLVIIAIGSTDLLFALDSIPAAFGVTQNAYLVFTANAFALFGLRALYFLLKGLLDRLIYLSLGLAAILVFIGVKLVLTWAHETWSQVPKIPTLASLGVICDSHNCHSREPHQESARPDSDCSRGNCHQARP